MMDPTGLTTAVGVAIGLPGLLGAGHLGLLTVGSWFYREPTSGAPGELRFLVMIPAHDEEKVIAAGLAAIMSDRRPHDQVLVVADRCTDRTAEIARSLGAAVLERGAAEPAGRAAARQAGLEHGRSLPWDAVVMLDADSIIEPGFFAACERALSQGAGAVQARSESSRGSTLAAEAALAAFTLQGVTIPRGRDRLGVSVRLRGTGMAIRRDIALAHRFRAPASEDLFFTLDLLLDGVGCRHVDSARLRSQGAPDWASFGGQKARYEAGRMAAAFTYVPRLVRRGVRRRDPACLEAAWFLASPPFAIGILSLLLGAGVTTATGAWGLVAVFAGGLGLMGVALLTGLIQARAGIRTWLALGAAPWYLGWKAAVQVRAVASLVRRKAYYEPTIRV